MLSKLVDKSHGVGPVTRWHAKPLHTKRPRNVPSHPRTRATHVTHTTYSADATPWTPWITNGPKASPEFLAVPAPLGAPLGAKAPTRAPTRAPLAALGPGQPVTGPPTLLLAGDWGGVLPPGVEPAWLHQIYSLSSNWWCVWHILTHHIVCSSHCHHSTLALKQSCPFSESV